MEKQNYECTKEFEEDNKIHNAYVNLIMINLNKAGDFREVLEYINEDLYQNLLSLDEMAKNCHEYLKSLTIKELKDLIDERPDLLSMKNYLTEKKEKEYLKERRERDVFFNKDTKEIYCEYIDELSDKEEREETKNLIAEENEISIEKIGFVRFSRNPLIYQYQKMESKKLCFKCGEELQERESLNGDFFVGHCPNCELNYMINEMDEEEVEDLKDNGYEFKENEENN